MNKVRLLRSFSLAIKGKIWITVKTENNLRETSKYFSNIQH